MPSTESANSTPRKRGRIANGILRAAIARRFRRGRTVFRLKCDQGNQRVHVTATIAGQTGLVASISYRDGALRTDFGRPKEPVWTTVGVDVILHARALWRTHFSAPSEESSSCSGVAPCI
ncbi:hypothetical protein GCM10027447_27850 [Glycomyces halotolerans]